MNGEMHPRARRVWRAREEMILRRRDEGLTYTEMAARLGISAHRLRAIGERAIGPRTDPKQQPESS
jgi:DNA-binding CsgD family transcriptional regulator